MPGAGVFNQFTLVNNGNVPAQALGLMHHPFVHQQAQVSAQRLLQEANSNSDFNSRLTSLFHRMLSRPPTPVELGEYTQFFERLRAAHGVSTQEAIGSNAVWKEFIHSLYNLKEFSYVL